MAFSLRAKRLDIATGGTNIVVLRGRDAENFGILPGDKLELSWDGQKQVVTADISHNAVQHGEIGLFHELWKGKKIHEGDAIMVAVLSRPVSVQAIRKRLLGKPVSDAEINSIITDIVNGRLGEVETTYFVAAGFLHSSPPRELVALTRAMAASGEQFHWATRRVVDKHSVGGVAGNRTTMVVIPIVSALGLTIPKTSSRAITSPAGTADTMEVLAPVSFDAKEVRRIVKKTGACLIWGGGLAIAPADDLIIRVSRPLSLEPYDKMLVSIMAKKVAMGVKTLVIDMPIGHLTKIPNRKTANMLAKKFVWLGRQFGMRVQVEILEADEPVGRGVGPALEARDVLRVLQQKSLRPMDLEEKSIHLSGVLLELSGAVRAGRGEALARSTLQSGAAWKQMQKIIAAQGGNARIDSDTITLSAFTRRINAEQAGRVVHVDNRSIDEVARTLGAPSHKLGGVYVHQRVGDRVSKGDKLYTLYARNADRLQLAELACRRTPLLTIR